MHLQNAERDGKIVGRTFFADGGGGKIDDDTFFGVGEVAVLDGGLDTLAALTHGGVGKPDYIGAWKSPCGIYFDFYNDTFETHKSARKNTR